MTLNALKRTVIAFNMNTTFEGKFGTLNHMDELWSDGNRCRRRDFVSGAKNLPQTASILDFLLRRELVLALADSGATSRQVLFKGT